MIVIYSILLLKLIIIELYYWSTFGYYKEVTLSDGHLQRIILLLNQEQV